MLAQIIIGIIGITAGVLFVVYARKLVEWFGTMATAEQKLGYGGTYNVLRIFGIVLVFTSLLFMFGFLGQVFSGIIKLLGFTVS